MLGIVKGKIDYSRLVNLQVGKVGLPPLKIEFHSNLDRLFKSSYLQVEWHSIWSGGKPTFPTYKLAGVESSFGPVLSRSLNLILCRNLMKISGEL